MAGAQGTDVQRMQSQWLGDWRRYLARMYAPGGGTALEVGCGAGFVMSDLSDLLHIKGIDIDPVQVGLAKERGMDVKEGDGLSLRYDDGSFDIVLCSFYLMWVKDMQGAVDEMLRVSKNGALILSEPVWSRSLYAPEGLKAVVDAWTYVIAKEGGDPEAGLKTAELVGRYGGRFGSVPVEMGREAMEKNVAFEYSTLKAKGIKLRKVRPFMFQVPFIWGFVPKDLN